MKLYCEKVTYDSKTGFSEVIFDFINEDSVKSFSFEILRESPKDLQSLIVLNNVKHLPYKGFRSGFWYNLPYSFFTVSTTQENIEDDYNSRILMKFEYISDELVNAQNFKMNSEYVHTTVGVDSNRIDFDLEKDLIDYFSVSSNAKLIVRNVGCGNWNEIKSEDKSIFYDLGGDIKYSDKEMNYIIQKSNLENNYVCIVSHWDLDHYRAILDLPENVILKMQYLIIPTQTANTVQFQKTISRIQNLNIKIIRINPTVRSIKNRVTLSISKVIQSIDLYRSCDGADINQSGIVLFVRGNNKNLILTGDHHYGQLKDSVLKNLDLDKRLVFVVPHHGGNAGTFNSRYQKFFPEKLEGAISTKKGRYTNLPRSDVHNFFVGLNDFHCTDCKNGDYTTIL